jgi:hypothetical protein
MIDWLKRTFAHKLEHFKISKLKETMKEHVDHVKTNDLLSM